MEFSPESYSPDIHFKNENYTVDVFPRSASTVSGRQQAVPRDTQWVHSSKQLALKHSQ